MRRMVRKVAIKHRNGAITRTIADDGAILGIRLVCCPDSGCEACQSSESEWKRSYGHDEKVLLGVESGSWGVFYLFLFLGWGKLREVNPSCTAASRVGSTRPTNPHAGTTPSRGRCRTLLPLFQERAASHDFGLPWRLGR